MLPNILSLLRIPLSLLLLFPNPLLRVLSIAAACLSDVADGAIARRWNLKSQWGKILDPFTDKWFAFFALGILLWEEKISSFQALLFVSREVMLFIFLLMLIVRNQWKNYSIRAIFTGKVITSLQFFSFILLFANYTAPMSLYYLFGLLGIVSFIELFLRDRYKPAPEK